MTNPTPLHSVPSFPFTSRRLVSTVRSDATLQLGFATFTVFEPGPDEVVIQVEAAPINPSDLGLVFAGADLQLLESTGDGFGTVADVALSPQLAAHLTGRVDQELVTGNEGAGTVIATGTSPTAQALLGRVVEVAGGAMYAEHRTVQASSCLVLNEGASATLGASSFVNPMTVLAMVETMRLEGHQALIHTAAASNLGQMLVRLCASEGIALVNIVRSVAQEDLLRSLGAAHVCNSTSPNFAEELTAAIAATSATLAFDATGGGTLASQILAAMEASLTDLSAPYNRYGSSTHKQVYLYGGLDRSPTVIHRTFGFSWGLGGWLLTPFLVRAGAEAIAKMRTRVAAELSTTFASNYAGTIALDSMLEATNIARYAAQATGEKYLVTPSHNN